MKGIGRREGIALGLIALCLVVPARGAYARPADGATPLETTVIRRVVMKDALSAGQLLGKLEELKKEGQFRQNVSADPKTPNMREISFVNDGNVILVTGEKAWVDTEIRNIRLLAFLSERPRAYVQLKLRVVQLTGPANAEVVQMTEAVQALVDAERRRVLGAFADCKEYLLQRLARRQGEDKALYDEVRKLLPGFGDPDAAVTVPDILLLMMLDRTLPPLPPATDGDSSTAEAEESFLRLPRKLDALLLKPDTDDVSGMDVIRIDLMAWQQAVTRARDWCRDYEHRLDGKDTVAMGALRQSLQGNNCPLPAWLTQHLRNSLALTDRLYPLMAQRQTQETLRELGRRFDSALQDADRIKRAIDDEASQDSGKQRSDRKPSDGKQSGGKDSKAQESGAASLARRDNGSVRNLYALRSITEQLVSLPRALFESVIQATEDAGPNREQLVRLFREYAEQRRLLEARLSADDPKSVPTINYARLEALEATLNLYLRRTSEAVARALERQFYNGYVEQLRLLANKRLGGSSVRDILTAADIESVPDVARDLLLADTGVNVFVSNSIGMQFAPDTTNSVSAQVQARLPGNTSLTDRIDAASKAADALDKLNKDYGVDGADFVRAILAGGQAVPVQSGLTLSAKPSVGFDASTVTLNLTASQTLEPDSPKITDRVTRHQIDNATITATSYEPTVLSSLTSNMSYFENTGGVPILKHVPGVRDALNDIAALRERKRQKGVYQSSVLILEPVVIPTFEDLLNFHAGGSDTGNSDASHSDASHRDAGHSDTGHSDPAHPAS